MVWMHLVQLSAIDLNLLRVLGALLETGSVKDAARRLALSPSATSHALSRLRDALGDPILVRAGRSMVPTARAEALAPRVRRVLEDAEQIFVRREGFDPARLRRVFRILTNDYGELMVLAPLGATLAREAPGVDLYASGPPPGGVVEGLRSGEGDLAIGVFGELPPDIAKRRLFRDGFVTLLREGHPALRGRWTRKRFAALDHVLVSPRGTPGGVIDTLLAESGLERRVARTVSSFFVAPHLLVDTDYVLTVSERVAARLAPGLGLVTRTPPVAPEGFHVSMVWHRRHDEDAEHRFLRERALAEAQAS